MNINSVYSYLNKIPLDDYLSARAELDKQYQKIESIDFVINNSNVPIVEFDNLSKSNCHGRFIINHCEIMFQCLITEPLTELGKNSLFIIFGGSKSTTTPHPGFYRWSYYKFIDSYVLNIADPMFQDYPNLTLGWYYGKENISYVYLMSEIVKKISNVLSIRENNIYFFGSSGGGYVALFISKYFTKTTSIAINPQIDLKKFPTSSSFEKITGINLSKEDKYERNNLKEIINRKISQNYYLIVQNFDANHDVKEHLIPLLKSIGCASFQIGLNKKENFLLWLYDSLGNHFEQGDKLIFSHILNFANHLSNNELTVSDYTIAKNISLIWKSQSEEKFKTKFHLIRQILNDKESSNIINKLVSLKFIDHNFINLCINKLNLENDNELTYKICALLIDKYDIVSVNYEIAKLSYSQKNFHKCIQTCLHILEDLNFSTDNLYLLLANSYFHMSDYINFEESTDKIRDKSSILDKIQYVNKLKTTYTNFKLKNKIPGLIECKSNVSGSAYDLSSYILTINITNIMKSFEFLIKDHFNNSIKKAIIPQNLKTYSTCSIKINLHNTEYIYLIINNIDLEIIEVCNE